MKLNRKQTAQLITLVKRYNKARQEFKDPSRPNIEASQTVRMAQAELAAFIADVIQEALDNE